MAEYDLLILKL